MTKGKPAEEYVALTGLNYPSALDGKERRVEIGDTFSDMLPTSLKHELAAGNVKPVGSEDDTPEGDENPEGSE